MYFGKHALDIYGLPPDLARHIQELVDVHYPKAKKIILVLDNLNIHTGAALYE